MRVAIVHEWLVTLGGSELVLAELLKVFPDAEVFTLIDRMDQSQRDFLGVRRTSTSFLQKIPQIERHYRKLLPLFPAAVRSLDLREVDIVISNSHAVAKGARTRPGQIHICYCLSPMRYAWDLREQYLEESGLSRGVRGAAVRAVLDRLRAWDLRTSQDVHAFATLSHYIADRIRRAYDRPATVIYPPVDTEFFSPATERSRGDYYVTASRFVPYKRVDLIARAFATELPDRRLIVVGDGPDREKVASCAGPNVTLAGAVSRTELRELLRGARGFVFAAEEDFGIAPVEAQACGCPVIAFGRGGATETVRGVSSAECDATGVFFEVQTPSAIAAAVRELEGLEVSAEACRRNAERFNAARFRREFGDLVSAQWQQFATVGPARRDTPRPG